ncbi:MAG TPA: GNAT family N-acetyltransferase [Ktedonobacterales bacterium]
MRITELTPTDEVIIQQIAAILVDGFAENWPGYLADRDAALNEIRKSFAEDRISLVALEDAEHALGWIGGISQYSGHVWELHPLVVAPAQQGRGVGRALVATLEARIRERGGLTVILGTDDVSNQTTLSGVSLLPDPWTHIARIQNLHRHPYEFYQKLGYVITGVVPDANGAGKPDILMAKSLAH